MTAEEEFARLARQFEQETRADNYFKARQVVGKHVAMAQHARSSEELLRAWDYMASKITAGILAEPEGKRKDAVLNLARNFAAAVFHLAETPDR